MELADCSGRPAEQPGQSWSQRRDGALVEEVSGMCLTAPAAATPAERLRLADCGDHRVDQAWALPV